MEIANRPASSISTTIGTITSAVISTIEKMFDPGYFNHIYVNTKHVSKERSDKKASIIKFKTPALSIKPVLLPNGDTYAEDFGMKHRFANLIIDNDNGIDVLVNFSNMIIEYEIKMKMETSVKAMDMVAYLKEFFVINTPFNLDRGKAPTVANIPNNIIIKLMTLLGLNNSSYENINVIVAYLNKYSADSGVIFYKNFNLSTGRYVISYKFIKPITTMVDGEINYDIGSSNESSEDNYVGLKLVCNASIPTGYRLFLDDNKKIYESYVNFVKMYNLLKTVDVIDNKNAVKLNMIIYDLLYKTSSESVIEDNLFILLTDNKFVNLKKRFDDLMNTTDINLIKTKLLALSDSFEYIDFVNEVKKNLSEYFGNISETDTKVISNIDIGKDYNLLPDYIKAIVDSNVINKKNVDKTKYFYDFDKKLLNDYEYKYESELVGSKDKLNDANNKISPFNKNRKIIVDYFKYTDLLNHITRDMMFDSTNELSPFNPIYDLINLPNDSLLNPNNPLAITNPDNAVSPFNIVNGLMDYPESDFRCVRINKRDILNPIHPRSLFNPNNINSPYNNADLLNLPTSDLNSPYNRYGLTCPLSHNSIYYIFMNVSELNNTIKPMKNPIALSELHHDDLLSPYNTNGYTAPTLATSSFYFANTLQSQSFVYVDDITKIDETTLEQSLSNKESGTTTNTTPENEASITLLVNNVNSNKDVEYKSTDSLVERTNDKFMLSYSLIAKPEEYKDGKKLFYNNAFLSDVNVLINELDLSGEISKQDKSIINYYLSEKQDINKLFYVTVYGRSHVVEKSKYDFNWYNYKLYLTTPKLNMSYFIAIYMDEDLFNRYKLSYLANNNLNI